MAKLSIQNVDVTGKDVLVRVDFNVPLDGGSITDDRRIAAALPTIKSIIERGGRAILMSHLGRPKGEGHEPALSLKPIAERLSQLLGKPVGFPTNDCTTAGEAIDELGDGDVILLENLRFHHAEKTGDSKFAASLADFGDIYVNDAFGTCHRSDASMVAVPTVMKGSPRAVGFLVEKEIRYLTDVLADPQRPFVVVLGGAKVSDKLLAIENLLPQADNVIVGGAMAYTFIKALGHDVGTSIVETGMIAEAKRIIEQAANHKAELHLPFDHICSTQFSATAGDIGVFEDNIKDGYMGLDIGPKTQARFAELVRNAKTVVWNGPMGVSEWPPFRVGTQQVAKAMAEATASGATTIVGGGDSAAAIEKFGFADQVSHVSTGGGASLKMLEGKPFEALTLIDEA